MACGVRGKYFGTAFLSKGNYENSVFGDENHTITVCKPFLQQGRFDFAVCNVTRKAFASLYGQVASFSFGLAADDPGVPVHFSFDNVRLIDAQGHSMPVNIQNNQLTTSLFDAADPVRPMRILPNPAENAALTRFGQALAGNVQIEVVDLNGRVVRAVRANGGPGTGDVPLDISGLARGLYTVHARDAAGVFVGKLAVQQRSVL